MLESCFGVKRIQFSVFSLYRDFRIAGTAFSVTDKAQEQVFRGQIDGDV